MTAVESLDVDFLEEDIVSDIEGAENEILKEEEEELPAVALEEEVAMVEETMKIKKKDKKKTKAKKFNHLTFQDFGMDNVDLKLSVYSETPDAGPTNVVDWCGIIDSIYEKQEKPLYVKSHTKVKVLIVCSSALRCVDVIRSLKKGLHQNVAVAKLFARHMKVNDQLKVLKESKFLVGVGTPARLLKIMELDPEAIPLKKLDFMLIDSTYMDAKNMTILDLPDTGLDLKKLNEIVRADVQMVFGI